MVAGTNLLIRLYAYLQEITMPVFNGKSETTITPIAVVILRIVVGCELVNELPGCYMQRKNTQ